MSDGQNAVAAPAAAAAVQQGAPGGAAPQQQRGFWDIAKMLATRALFMYFLTTFLSSRRNAPATTTTTGPDGVAVPVKGGQNVFGPMMPMDLYAYVSERPRFYKFDEESLFWKENEILYGDYQSGVDGEGTFRKTGILEIPEAVQKNASNLYIHVYFVQSGASPRPTDSRYNPGMTLYKSFQLNKMKKVSTSPKKQNLLTGESKTPVKEEEPDKVVPPSIMVSHWHPNLTFNLVDDRTMWTKGRAPSPLSDYLEFDAEGNYFPILYFNDYWNLNKDYMPLNETTKTVNLTLTYYPLSLWKWQLYVSQSMSNKWTKMLNGGFLEGDGGDSSGNVLGDDSDSIKEALLDTNPILLALTMIVSILHTIFEFMAFKNDIQFWKNKGEDLEGLSVRSVFFNVAQSVIVLLYVMDNDTNPMVRISIAIGLAIEIWKIKKVMNVSLDRNNLVFGIFPRVRLEDKKSYVESSTRTYDQLAFKYLSWILFPLILAYGAYSLMYEEHKGWYSWVLGMLYGFLLTFGFISMTPQLFINYKLKSVAHLPWRMMTYKALNTFIDDIFAFVIKMPTMYRIGCLRDDVIFFIFLYQRWIYRVDPSRVNEYGYSKEMLEKRAAEAANGGGTAVMDSPRDEDVDHNSESVSENSSGASGEDRPSDKTVTRRAKSSRARKE
ncbi:putative lipid scramblase CLPTM1 [Paramacrobiotus metropolitanus]|uniref:putative lipid scramblase CLPTM1 n=1 Tax=Paramacrobiotus metropolitanus TaxID=2943436 RepID=UPI0024455FB4|nr:putative lipid scramblase CLPTM1 [Paramacrobiotus metropolitanus]